MTRLFLWRHGQTTWNAENRVQGHAEAPLSEAGVAQAVAAAAKLAKVQPDVLVSSDSQRAANTAAELAKLTDLPVSYDSRLRERCFGDWQGQLLADVTGRWPEAYARWRAGETVGDAGIEELDEFGKRVTSALQEIMAGAPANGTVVVATHGGSAKQGLGGLLGWPEPVIRTVRGLNNCHWTELRVDDVRGWQLIAHNVG